MWKKYKPYILSCAIALAVGGLSALLTKDNMDMAKDYIMPPLSPPGAVFPITSEPDHHQHPLQHDVYIPVSKSRYSKK